MATQMPQDPEFNRFIDGLKSNADGSADVELDEDVSDVEELEDGSAIVRLGEDKGPEEDADFYENLAESLVNLYDLEKVGMRYLDLVEKDQEARKNRDKQYEEGLKRTGLGNDAPGGAQFQGASKVVHPVMAEACVAFAARAIKELFPPDGPVRTKILGEATEEKTDRAERKRDWTNWQLTEQIEEFRDEQEQLLTQLPLGGSQYMKMWYDEQKKRPCAEFVPIDNILLPYAAVNFYTAQRVTEMQDITGMEFKRRIDAGLYRDIDFIRATSEPEQTASEKANDKIEGKSWSDNEDGLRKVYHIYTWLELEDDPMTKGELAPYILMIDDLEHKVLGLYRNWEEGDDTYTKLDWIIEFKFIPWRGAYAIGLPQLIGGLTAALTGALRALLDTAHINNSATMLKLKGAKVSRRRGDDVGGKKSKFCAFERHRCADRRAFAAVRVPGAVDDAAASGLHAQQFGRALVEFMVAYRGKFQACAIERLNRRLVVEGRRNQRAGADQVAGTDHDAQGIERP